jgi:hypothetical protein
VAFIEGDDVIQEITPAAAHPALRDRILPRAFEGSSDRAHFQGANGCSDFPSILGIPIKEEKPRSRIERKRLP